MGKNLKDHNSHIYLIKQLKQLKFKEEILINVYRSITLSIYNYSAPLLITTSPQGKIEMAKQQQRFFKIIGISSIQAYEIYNIPPIETFIEQSCVSMVDRILKDPSNPLTQAQQQLPQPKHFIRNSQVKLTKTKPEAYENSCLQFVVKLKRDGYKDKYTNPRRKEATSVE